MDHSQYKGALPYISNLVAIATCVSFTDIALDTLGPIVLFSGFLLLILTFLDLIHTYLLSENSWSKGMCILEILFDYDGDTNAVLDAVRNTHGIRFRIGVENRILLYVRQRWSQGLRGPPRGRVEMKLLSNEIRVLVRLPWSSICTMVLVPGMFVIMLLAVLLCSNGGNSTIIVPEIMSLILIGSGAVFLVVKVEMNLAGAAIRRIQRYLRHSHHL